MNLEEMVEKSYELENELSTLRDDIDAAKAVESDLSQKAAAEKALELADKICTALDAIAGYKQTRRKVRNLVPEPGLWRRGMVELTFDHPDEYHSIEVYIQYGANNGTPLATVTAQIGGHHRVYMDEEPAEALEEIARIHTRIIAIKSALSPWCLGRSLGVKPIKVHA